VCVWLCARAIPFLGKITSGACALSDVCVYIYTGKRDIYTSIRGYTVTYVLAVTMCAVCTETKKKKETIESAAYAYALQQQPQLFCWWIQKRDKKKCVERSQMFESIDQVQGNPPRWRTIPSSLDPSYARLSTFLLKWFRLQLQTGNKIEKVLTYLQDETLADPFFFLFFYRRLFQSRELNWFEDNITQLCGTRSEVFE
jgi:hypothetical protein